MSTNANALMFQKRTYTFKQTIKSIESVTVESVNACIREYFKLENMSIAVAGNIN
jgi:predicted Zn-dependent peptidase